MVLNAKAIEDREEVCENYVKWRWALKRTKHFLDLWCNRIGNRQREQGSIRTDQRLVP